MITASESPYVVLAALLLGLAIRMYLLTLELQLKLSLAQCSPPRLGQTTRYARRLGSRPPLQGIFQPSRARRTPPGHNGRLVRRLHHRLGGELAHRLSEAVFEQPSKRWDTPPRAHMHTLSRHASPWAARTATPSARHPAVDSRHLRLHPVFLLPKHGPSSRRSFGLARLTAHGAAAHAQGAPRLHQRGHPRRAGRARAQAVGDARQGGHVRRHQRGGGRASDDRLCGHHLSPPRLPPGSGGAPPHRPSAPEPRTPALPSRALQSRPRLPSTPLPPRVRVLPQVYASLVKLVIFSSMVHQTSFHQVEMAIRLLGGCAAPSAPTCWLLGLRLLLRTPERRPSRVEARRGLRSPPRAAPTRRSRSTLHVQVLLRLLVAALLDRPGAGRRPHLPLEDGGRAGRRDARRPRGGARQGPPRPPPPPARAPPSWPHARARTPPPPPPSTTTRCAWRLCSWLSPHRPCC